MRRMKKSRNGRILRVGKRDKKRSLEDESFKSFMSQEFRNIPVMTTNETFE